MGDWSVWHFLWTTLVVFLWIAVLLIFFNVVMDIFRSDDLSAVKKTLWLILLVVLPLLGILIYVLFRGEGMASRSVQRQIDQTEKLRELMAAGQSPAEQIEAAKRLHDSGAITDEEYAKLKQRALGD